MLWFYFGTSIKPKQLNIQNKEIEENKNFSVGLTKFPFMWAPDVALYAGNQ